MGDPIYAFMVVALKPAIFDVPPLLQKLRLFLRGLSGLLCATPYDFFLSESTAIWSRLQSQPLPLHTYPLSQKFCGLDRVGLNHKAGPQQIIQAAQGKLGYGFGT